MISKITKLLLLLCVIMNLGMIDARGRSSRSTTRTTTRSSSSSSRSSSSSGYRSGYSSGYSGGYSGGYRSSYSSYRSYVPVNYYTRSTGTVVVVTGSMGYGQYYYDGVYNERILNPNYGHHPPSSNLGFFCACCCFCSVFLIIFWCNGCKFD